MLVFRDSAGSKVSFTLLPVSSPPVEEFWAVSVKKVRLIPSGLIIVMVLAVDPMISPETADEMECLLACSGISPVIPSTVMPSRVVPLNSPV